MITWQSSAATTAKRKHNTHVGASTFKCYQVIIQLLYNRMDKFQSLSLDDRNSA